MEQVPHNLAEFPPYFHVRLERDITERKSPVFFSVTICQNDGEVVLQSPFSTQFSQLAPSGESVTRVIQHPSYMNSIQEAGSQVHCQTSLEWCPKPMFIFDPNVLADSH